MLKCIYKCGTDKICCCSSSEHHCEVVTDAVCGKCELIQDKPTISPEQRLKNIIIGALDILPSNPGNVDAVALLRTGLR